MSCIHQLTRDDQGATAIEYALIASLIAMALVTAVGGFGGELNDIILTTEMTVQDAPSQPGNTTATKKD